MESLPNYDSWKLAAPPEGPPQIASVSEGGVCRCSARTYPHRVASSGCMVCPNCHTADSDCRCLTAERRQAQQWYRQQAQEGTNAK